MPKPELADPGRLRDAMCLMREGQIAADVAGGNPALAYQRGTIVAIVATLMAAYKCGYQQAIQIAVDHYVSRTPFNFDALPLGWYDDFQTAFLRRNP